MRRPKYTNGALSKGGVYIPKRLCLEVLQKYHDSPWGGHEGQAATYAKMVRDVYWPNLMAIGSPTCAVMLTSCQKNWPVYRAKGGLLKPLPIPTVPWKSISMDFITRPCLDRRVLIPS